MKNIYYLILLFAVACSSQPDSSYGLKDHNRFLDKTSRKIADWQDRRQTDSLLNNITNYEDLYKKEIALAFASIQDPKAIPALADLFDNPDEGVREAAAFALGQMYDSTAYKHLAHRLKNEESSEVRSSILEAMGKTIPRAQVGELINFIPEDSISTTGWAYGIYRAGLRGVYNSGTTNAAIKLLDTARAMGSKLAAAHYLARIQYNQIPSAAYEIINKEYRDPEIRMAVASIFGKAPSLVAASGLRKFLTDKDYRVRINAVRAIPNDKIGNYLTFLDTLLADINPNTSVATAEKIVLNASSIGVEKIKDRRKKKINWRSDALLREAALVVEPSNEDLIEETKKAFLSARDPQQKAVLLSALKHSFRAYDFIITEMFKAEHPAISTAGISALAAMRRKKDFPTALKPAFADVFKRAIESGDAAMIDISAAILRDKDAQYKKEITDFSFIIAAKEKLKLPRENETLQSLERTLAFFENREPDPVVNEFNHPVDWDKAEKLEGLHEAAINTNKGEVRINLYTNHAPGTVLNFVSLAKSGYFTGKTFHRVVPNFVVQGGGNRGDGWGGEDYSIRSEFANLKYTTGTLGMASAGKDTEGTQWFITHSPTPHLDGRYTIFAQVIEGMDVVHKLEQGDKINSVSIN